MLKNNKKGYAHFDFNEITSWFTNKKQRSIAMKNRKTKKGTVVNEKIFIAAVDAERSVNHRYQRFRQFILKVSFPDNIFLDEIPFFCNIYYGKRSAQFLIGKKKQ